MNEGYFFPQKPPGELIAGDPGWSLLLLMSCGMSTTRQLPWKI